MIIIGPALKKEIYFLMVHIVENGIKLDLRIKKYMLAEFMAKKFGLILLMKFLSLCSHQENSHLVQALSKISH